jgi:hypothetical protein
VPASVMTVARLELDRYIPVVSNRDHLGEK